MGRATSNYGLPSYDVGSALEWSSGPWSVNALGLNIGENDDGNNFNFWGIQGSYRASTSLGTGSYRLILAGASSAFLNSAGTKKEGRLVGGISLDQELVDVVGIFLRLAWQQEDAAVDYRAFYSGGFNLNGSAWGREPDNMGIGYAYLDGGNLDIEHTHVFEMYYRLGLSNSVGLTADIQYMKDDYTKDNPVQDNPDGWIFGLRFAVEF